jgi:hypothetical protein
MFHVNSVEKNYLNGQQSLNKKNFHLLKYEYLSIEENCISIIDDFLFQLFCCTEYREFVEAVLEMQKQENDRIDSKQIDVQPHGKARSRRARQLAEERAKTRLV